MNKHLYSSLITYYNDYYDKERKNPKKKYYNDDKISLIEKGTTHIQFKDSFNYPINKGFIPNTILHLYFGDMFNQPINEGVLPDNIEFLYFGDRFNQKLNKNCLPKNLKDLEFGSEYNIEIEKDVLPENLVYLKFGPIFNKHCVFPNNLKKLIFGQNFNKIFYDKCSLPQKLEYLKLGFKYNKTFYKIKNGEKINLLPNSLKKLHIGHMRMKIKTIFNSNSLPHNLFELYINYSNINSNTFLSMNNIVTLHLIIDNKRKIENIIPKTIRDLTLLFFCDLVLEKNDIPENVKILYITNYENELNEGIIPNSIEELSLCCPKMKINVGAIPNSVKYLYINIYDFKLEKNVIPTSVIYLTINNISNIDTNIDSSYLPKSIKILNIQSSRLNLSNFVNDNNNLIGVVCCRNNFIPSNNNIVIGKMLGGFIKYNILNIELYNYEKIKIDNIITDFIVNNNNIGNIIFEELVSKVFNPNRLLTICEKYNIDFDELNDIY